MASRTAQPRRHPTPDSELMSTEQVSQLTGIKGATLRYWRSVDQGPASFRLGGRVLYRRASVYSWIAVQERTTKRGGLD